VPTLRHDDVRAELLAGLSSAGRQQLEAFASVYEARQVAAGLAELRAQAQLSQRETAKRAGIDQADLSRIESGRIVPSLPTLLRLIDAVGGSLLLARRAAPIASRTSKAIKALAIPTTEQASPPQTLAKRPVVRKAAAGRGRPAKLVAGAATTSAGKSTPAPAPTTGAAAVPTKRLGSVRAPRA
jgi:transcriptional regulator with XRE-family HTH domain